MVIVVISKNSSNSKWLKFELNKAISKMVEGECWVIPILKGDVKLPDELHGILYADFRKGSLIGFRSVFAALGMEVKKALEKSREDIHEFIAECFDYQGSDLSENDYDPIPYYYFKLNGLEEVRFLEYPSSGGKGDRVVYEIIKDKDGSKKPLDNIWWSEYNRAWSPYQTSFHLAITERPIKIPEVQLSGIPHIWCKVIPRKEQFGTVVVFADISDCTDSASRKSVILNVREGFDHLLKWVRHLKIHPLWIKKFWFPIFQ